MQTQDIGQGLPETVSLLDRLRIAIYRGELAPGQRLVESELAQKYDTSRGAVREALALLQNEGLITRQVEAGSPVRVSYELTCAGHELQEAMDAVGRWAERWIGANDHQGVA